MSVFEVLMSFGQYRRGQVHEHESGSIREQMWRDFLARGGYVRELEVIRDAPSAGDIADAVLADLDAHVARTRRTRKKAEPEVTDGQDSPEPGDDAPDGQE